MTARAFDELGWGVTIDRVYDGPLVDPATGETLPDTHGVAWHLTLRRGAAALRVWWMPEERVLGGERLAGWSKHAIGRLKRHPIGLGRSPPA